LLKLLVLVFVVFVIVLGGLATFRTGAIPTLTLTPEVPGLGRKTPVRVTAAVSGRGLSRVRLEVVQEDHVHVVAEKVYVPRPAWAFWGPLTERAEIRAEVGADNVPGLKPGEAVLRAVADRAGTWLLHPRAVVQERKVPVRLSPPALSVASAQHYVAQGGAEAVVYRVGASSVRDGVRAGEWFFPGYPLPGGGPEDRLALFAVPYDLGDGTTARLVAEDDVENQAEVTFIDKFFAKPFGKDRITVDDAFMSKVVPEIRAKTPDLSDRGSLLENYLVINREVREQNAKSLVELAGQSNPHFLWKEVFLPMPNGKVMSAFADRRTYLYEGKEVDRQFHLGFDLASVQRAPVPAGNAGIVVLARYFGIYGNAVVVDHGYGLMSLYAHLSSIEPVVGQEVARGQTLGQTGATGLAGGDHLHFTTLLQGLPVNPNEWWDAHWIEDRLVRKLGAALPFTPPSGPEGKKAAKASPTSGKKKKAGSQAKKAPTKHAKPKKP
jgi:murein DD-endopeptidase MepM/ murein hydrolase activator NlpD